MNMSGWTMSELSFSGYPPLNIIKHIDINPLYVEIPGGLPHGCPQERLVTAKWFGRMICLVVSNIFYFPFHIWDVILPIDELIFFRGVDTTNQ